MDAVEVLADLYGRIPDAVHSALDGLADSDLFLAPGEGNPIGWLVWHTGRVLDAQLSELDGAPQIWAATGWARRFGLPEDSLDTGYGQTRAEVLSVRPSDVSTLREWTDAMAARSRQFLADCTPPDLDRPVDSKGDPALTWGVRLVSIAEDCLSHAAQAGYVRGLLRSGSSV